MVTGGAGFIGSHLVDALVEAGHQVTVVDDLSSGHQEYLNPRVRFHQASVTDAAVLDILQKERPQIVCHHAAQVSVLRSVDDPREDARVNVLGGLNVLEACVHSGVKRFIFASTGGALYGEPQQLPCSEEHPVKPLSPYGAAKAAVETYLHYYGQTQGLQTFALRYANVYGPRQDPYGEAGVIAIFARALLDGRSVTIFGDGEQERDFVYVSDVVAANLACLASDQPGAYNIGTGRGTSVNRILAELRRFTGSRAEATHVPAKAGEVYRIYLDSRRAQEHLGWAPQISLAQGLAQTVDYFRDVAPAPPSGARFPT